MGTAAAEEVGHGVVGILGAVFGSMAALFVLLVIAAAMLRGSSRSDTTTPVAIPSYTYDTGTPSPSESRSQTRSSEPTATRSAEPETPTRATLNTSTRNNTLYRAGALPRWPARRAARASSATASSKP